MGAWLRRLLDRDPLTYRRVGNVDPSAPFVVLPAEVDEPFTVPNEHAASLRPVVPYVATSPYAAEELAAATSPYAAEELAAAIERHTRRAVVEAQRAEVRSRLEVLLAEAGITYAPWQMDVLTGSLVPYVDIPDQHAYSRRGQTPTPPEETP